MNNKIEKLKIYIYAPKRKKNAARNKLSTT